jgi:MmgE/PrpD C-terminal domain
VTAFMKDGRKVHVFVEHAIGSLRKPMTDKMLEAKFSQLSEPVIGSAKSRQLIEACWGLGSAADVRALAALTRP